MHRRWADAQAARPAALPVITECSNAVLWGCADQLVDHVHRGPVGIAVAARQSQELLIKFDLRDPRDVLERELDALRLPIRRHPSQGQVRRQLKGDVHQLLLNQPGGLAPWCLPRHISAGSCDLCLVLLAIEVQVGQPPGLALVLVRVIGNGSCEDADVIAEVDPGDLLTVWRGHHERRDHSAPSFAARAGVQRDAPAEIARQKRTRRSEHLGWIETAPILRDVGERVRSIYLDGNDRPVRATFLGLELKGQK